MAVPARAFDHRSAAARGISWMMLQTVGVRALNFLGQLILGWLLLPRDFGLYALALSIANAVGALRNGGVAQLMLRQSGAIAPDTARLTQFALLFNIAAAGLLIGIAPLGAARFENSEIQWLVVWIGLSFPLGTFATVFRCQLTVAERYRELATLGLISTVFWQLGTIGMALAGFGPFSYVVPTAFQGVVETAIGYLYLREWPRLSPRINRVDIVEMFRNTRWVMLGAAMLSLATTGDYFAVGLFADAQTVGWYFFAFQLVVSVGTLISYGVETVLPPILARIDGDRQQQSRAVLEIIETLMLVSWPLAGIVSFGAAPAIHFLWGGKWDDAVIAVALIAFCLPAWVYLSIGRALIEARGQWRARFAFLTIYGIGGAASAAFGAVLGSLHAIASSVTIFYLGFAFCIMLIVTKVIAVPPATVIRATGVPAIVCIVSVVVANLISRQFGTATFWPRAEFVALPMFLAIATILNCIVLRREWNKTRSVWRMLRSGRAARQASPL